MYRAWTANVSCLLSRSFHNDTPEHPLLRRKFGNDDNQMESTISYWPGRSGRHSRNDGIVPIGCHIRYREPVDQDDLGNVPPERTRVVIPGITTVKAVYSLSRQAKAIGDQCGLWTCGGQDANARTR